MPDLNFFFLLKSLFEWMNASLFSFDHTFEMLDFCSFGTWFFFVICVHILCTMVCFLIFNKSFITHKKRMIYYFVF